MSTKKQGKICTPEFKVEALKLAARIGVTAAVRELNIYDSQIYNWKTTKEPELNKIRK